MKSGSGTNLILVHSGRISYLLDMKQNHKELIVLEMNRVCHKRCTPPLRITVVWGLRSSRMLLNLDWLVSCRRFGTASVPSWPLKMGTVGCLETSETTNLRCVTTQKWGDLVYNATEASNHDHFVWYCFST